MQFTCAKNHQITSDIQMLQAKTSVGTTLVGPPCIYTQMKYNWKVINKSAAYSVFITI